MKDIELLFQPVVAWLVEGPRDHSSPAAVFLFTEGDTVCKNGRLSMEVIFGHYKQKNWHCLVLFDCVYVLQMPRTNLLGYPNLNM